MEYISTRGKAPVLNFEEVVITGLASDGGLYVPDTLPKFSKQDIADMAGLSYCDLMFKIISPFIEGEIPDDTLKNIIKETYKEFRHSAIAPLEQIGNQEFILELFNGPTMAFKDFALQFVGRIIDYILTKRGEHVTIIGATSGDTGSAAIEGCKHSKFVDIFIMHPHDRVSDVQRKQMTTILDYNVHNMAVKGLFDDCQNIVKGMFADQSFLNGKSKLVAVNSINWCRIMAQIVYYFYSAVQLGAPHREVSYSVPTGNFGDVFAGYVARRMGLPIQQLIVATNKNDILHRFFDSNDYSYGSPQKTLSPSMDIQVSSNFERLLFYIYNKEGLVVSDIMNRLDKDGITIDENRLANLREIFSSYSVSDEVTCEVIKEIFETTGELIDPHTAVAVKSARECRKNLDTPMVILSTAHPSKFPEAMVKAGVSEVPLPFHLKDLMSRKEKYEVFENNMDVIKNFIVKSGNY